MSCLPGLPGKGTVHPTTGGVKAFHKILHFFENFA
jgi:hypothetical protein